MKILSFLLMPLWLGCLATAAAAQSNESRGGDGTFTSGWRICNQSDYETVYVAYSFFEDDQWVTRGWRKIPKSSCEVFQTEITNNTAYYYAVSDDEDAEWLGEVNICAHPTEKFEYFGDVKDCPSNHETFPFYALDLEGQTVVTRNLTSE
ncbi:MAG: DUF1036 domain-containing protein [Pseudomonadota bacterium]